MDEQSVTSLLREKGFKVTPQRLAIYDVLYNTTQHPNAEMIFNQLQPDYPTMSLATVYKTIEILKELGIVQVLNVGEDSFRYDANTQKHSHVCCMHCKRVDDIFEVDSSRFIQEVAGKVSYRLTGQQFYFYGICEECQSETAPVH